MFEQAKQWLKKEEQTVETILGEFAAIVGRLEDHAEEMAAKVEAEAKSIEEAVVRKERALAQVFHANEVVKKLRALFGLGE